jgi:hypothetical protein
LDTPGEQAMVDEKRSVRVSPNTLYRELQGETVLLQLDSGEYFGLDEISTRIWQLIVETGDLTAVEAAMVKEFEVDRAVLAQDLTRVVDDLVAKRLIETDES